VREIPTSRYAPPSGFLNLSAACSVVGPTGLFHPAATSRVRARPSRGFSRSAAVPGSSPGPAPMPLVRTCSPATRLPHARPSTSRLPSAERCVRSGRWLAFPSAAPLFGFLLLQALAPPPSARLPVARPSTRDVASAVFFTLPFGLVDLATSARLQRVVGGLAGVVVSETPSCSRFRAFRSAARPPRRTVSR